MYVPPDYLNLNLVEGPILNLCRPVDEPTIVREVRCTGASFSEDKKNLLLQIYTLDQPVLISASKNMRFGNESITARDYFKRVIELDDFVDFILLPGSLPHVSCFWIHIKYVGSKPDDLTFSKKDDGLFSMNAKSGEKAERRVAQRLSEKFGHSYPDEKLQGNGCFEIRYTNKKKRSPDLICSVCQLQIEVKKRNKDEKFRISHSRSRPWKEENGPLGWHALVFPDMSIHFVSNQQITKLLNSNSYVDGRNQYDAWADLDKALVQEEAPPLCS